MGDGVSYLDLKPFQYLYKTCVPYWLKNGEGGAVLDSLGQLCDQFAARAYLGLVARFPDYAALHGLGTLGMIGRDRKIVRGINEPDAAYAARLKRFLTDHRVRGNPFALHDQLRAYCQADIMIRTVDQRGNYFTTAVGGARSVVLDSGNWDWDNTLDTNWSRFWVIMYPGTVWSTQLWGAGTTFGTTATVDQVSNVRGIIADWKPAGTTCEWIILSWSDIEFDPMETTDTIGTWGDWLAPGGDISNRYNSCRYWTGPRGSWTP